MELNVFPNNPSEGILLQLVISFYEYTSDGLI